MGAIIIITVITYRSPLTSLGISFMLFFLRDDHQAAMPGLNKVEIIWLATIQQQGGSGNGLELTIFI